jgi:hypothetical protein
MAIKYISIFHCKTLPNLRKWLFLVLKYTIWQPWPHTVFLAFKGATEDSRLKPPKASFSFLGGRQQRKKEVCKDHLAFLADDICGWE